MRFIVDALLPPALTRWLAEPGHDAAHVFDLDRGTASDTAIWNRAIDMSAAIVSKDEDFALRVQLRQDGPPVIWIRVGNTSTRELLRKCAPLWPSIVRSIEFGERLIEIV